MVMGLTGKTSVGWGVSGHRAQGEYWVTKGCPCQVMGSQGDRQRGQGSALSLILSCIGSLPPGFPGSISPLSHSHGYCLSSPGLSGLSAPYLILSLPSLHSGAYSPMPEWPFQRAARPCLPPTYVPVVARRAAWKCPSTANVPHRQASASPRPRPGWMFSSGGTS